MSDSKLSNRVRRLRFDNGEMTQQDLADKVGVTRQTIIAIESGKYAPSLPLASSWPVYSACPIYSV